MSTALAATFDGAAAGHHCQLVLILALAVIVVRPLGKTVSLRLVGSAHWLGRLERRLELAAAHDKSDVLLSKLAGLH